MLNKMKQITIFIVLLVFTFSCKTKEEKKKPKGIDISKMDTSVNPNQDFFHYVNGTWLKTTKIPDDRTSWGSFNELRKNTDDDMLAMLDDAIKIEDANALKDAKKNVTPTDKQKAIYLFKSFKDFKTRNKNGINPIKPYLAKIDAIKNIDDVQNYLIEMQALGGGGLYGIYIGPHAKNSKINAAYLYPGGLGLRRNYYVDTDKDTKEKLKKYEAHVSRMFQFFDKNATEMDKNAAHLVAFETAIASPRMTKEESRDARKRYNPMTLTELSKTCPSINWKKYINGLGIKKLDTIIVTDPNYFKALNTVLKDTPIKQIKNYLRWTAIDQSAGLLTKEMDKANWEFYSKTLQGAKKQRNINERALARVNGSVGEALGKLYVAKKFPPEAKEKAKKMIDNIILAFKHRIQNVTWMSAKTKKKAIEKLGKMTVKIAYPDKWKDYSKLNIAKGNSYFENSLATAKWRFNENVKKLGKEVDKTEWHMSPQTVNAYFNPQNNEIVFPAAILQAPFYDFEADDAVNYGGIGAVIGHEISHSFDDSGARYDGDGNLNNWWTEEDAKAFAKLGKKLEDQFSAIEALPGTFLNGKYTLGENIGDLGGVNVAYDGLMINYKNTKKPKKIDGFTPEQRFFMSWATVWRSKMRNDALINLIKTNPHSPGMYRGYMPLKNIDAFYQAFNITEKDSMYLKPTNRVKIW